MAAVVASTDRVGVVSGVLVAADSVAIGLAVVALVAADSVAADSVAIGLAVVALAVAAFAAVVDAKNGTGLGEDCGRRRSWGSYGADHMKKIWDR